MKFTKAVVTLLVMISALAAREKKSVIGIMGGIVVDERTQNPIIGAIVAMPELDVSDTTDSSGYFLLKNIPARRYDFEISAEGYTTCYKPSVIVKSGRNKDMQVPLQKACIEELDKMVVTAEKINFKKSEQTTSVIHLTRDEIVNSPGALSDVNEVLKILPSAIGTGYDWDNALLVRGGSESENVYIIDGMEVNNISHWGAENGSGGAISSFHPEFIDNIDFYAGGFPAYAPPRLSSVTEMYLRKGSLTDRSYQINLDMAGAGLFLEGPIVPGKASYIINGRVSFLDLIQKMINTDGLPKYQNGQMKLAWDITRDHSLYINLLGMHDEIEGNNNDEHYKEENSRLVGGIGWEYLSDRWKNRLLFSSGYARSDYFDREGKDRVLEDDFRDIRERYQVKNNCALFLREQDLLSFGGDVRIQKYNEYYANESFYFFADTGAEYQVVKQYPDLSVVYNSDTSFIETVDAYSEDTTLTGYRVGGYLSYTLGLKKLKIQGGVRDDYYSILREHGLSPRLAASLDLDNTGIFSISSGLHYQFPTYVRILSMKNFLDDIPLQRNWQVALGYEKQFGKHVVSGTEVYYKHYDREPLYEIKQQRRYIDTLFAKFGIRRAYGFELYVQKKKKDLFYYNFSYTLLNSELQYKNGKWHPDDYNLRNNATIVLGSQFHRFHAFCVRCDLSEGYPYTPIDTAASDIETRYNVSKGWNSNRRSFRAKIGLRYDLTWYLPRANVTIYVEVKNLLNQRDIVYEHYNPNDGGAITQYKGMGILPVGGLRIDF